MKVVFTPEVEEDLYEIVKMLIKRNNWVLYLIKYITNNHVSDQYIF